MSMVSFNSRMLYDQFQNLDSISQVGEDREAQYPSMDLSQMTVEIKLKDQKIKDLQTDRAKLKQLLKKAKVAIDSINGKYK